jgi:2-phospho-L-lactate guanylyltransferase (CobY/MobA/RfbA family)
MARPNSTVDCHPDRQKIIDAILAGKSLDFIAASVNPPLNRFAIWRYAKNHVAPALQKSLTVAKELHRKGLVELTPDDIRELPAAQVATRASLMAEPILARVRAHQETLDDAINGAMAEGDARSIAALVGADLKGLELQGRLNGALSEGQTTITAIQIVVPADVPRLQQDRQPECIDVECEDITVGR